jgi:hypothetical protein
MTPYRPFVNELSEKLKERAAFADKFPVHDQDSDGWESPSKANPD